MRAKSLLVAAVAGPLAGLCGGCCWLFGGGGCGNDKTTADHESVLRQRSAYDRGRTRPQSGEGGVFDYEEPDPAGRGAADRGGPVRDAGEPRSDRSRPREPAPDDPPASRPFTPGSSSNK